MKKLLIFFLILLIATKIKTRPLDLTLKQTIQVEVRGHLQNPGIFELQRFATLQDLLTQVILYEDSNLDTMSLQHVLRDRQMIMIEKTKENKRNLISINSATLEEFVLLPGIGDATANQILEYRQQSGGFLSLEQLMEVKGIGIAKFEKIKELIRL